MFEEAYVSGEQIVIVRVETGRLHGVWNLPVQVVCVHVCGCMRVCAHTRGREGRNWAGHIASAVYLPWTSHISSQASVSHV